MKEKGKIRITRVGSTCSLYKSDKHGNWMLIFDTTNLDGDFDVRFDKIVMRRESERIGGGRG